MQRGTGGSGPAWQLRAHAFPLPITPSRPTPVLPVVSQRPQPDRTSRSPRIPGPQYPFVRFSHSPALLEKWRRESGPIDHSGRTATAHEQRAPRRALRYRSAPTHSPVSPYYLLALLKGSFTSFDFISYETTLTSRSFYLTDDSTSPRAALTLEPPRVWQAVGSPTSGSLRSKGACAPCLLSLDVTQSVALAVNQ